MSWLIVALLWIICFALGVLIGQKRDDVCKAGGDSIGWGPTVFMFWLLLVIAPVFLLLIAWSFDKASQGLTSVDDDSEEDEEGACPTSTPAQAS